MVKRAEFLDFKTELEESMILSRFPLKIRGRLMGQQFAAPDT